MSGFRFPALCGGLAPALMAGTLLAASPALAQSPGTPAADAPAPQRVDIPPPAARPQAPQRFGLPAARNPVTPAVAIYGDQRQVEVRLLFLSMRRS